MCLKIGQLPGPKWSSLFYGHLSGKMVIKYGASPWLTVNFFWVPSRQTTILSTLKSLIVKRARLLTWHHFEKTCDGLDNLIFRIWFCCLYVKIGRMIPQKARWFQGFLFWGDHTWFQTRNGIICRDWNAQNTTVIPCNAWRRTWFHNGLEQSLVEPPSVVP